MRVLDAHLHLWDPSRLDYDWLEGPLARRFAAAELAQAPVGDEGAAVFVQAECVETQFLDEVRWVAETAPRTGVIGIVAGARLDRGEDTAAHLARLAELPLVVGVRHLLQGEPDGTAMSPAFLAGAAAVAAHGLRFDACVRAHQLPDVVALAAAVPELPVVLDHLGKPAVGTAADPRRPDAAWLRDIRALAAHPQVSVKLSGLPAEAGGHWDRDQIAPFLDAVAEAFGAERLLWGSDWPVSSVADDGFRADARAAWARAVADWAERRGADLDAVFWGNAARFYGLH
ncbi:L-fuconolactone hydrolase [Microbacterium sp. 8M]|uniref:amidohydrolase family protein n=1 Tax=Microbacterium sp. 8M TaxID=2653153 RepID=UPI0012F422CC|nr:amidohydrolase family protein [Microbacterium sp. 8M]VXB01533.1 L-fuconolactone hydrolase [Microbacterium sp. 8M]